MLLAIGVDPGGVKCAWSAVAWESSQVVHSQSLKLAKRSGPEACWNAADHFDRWIRGLLDESYRIGSIAIESPVLARGGARSALSVAYVAGAVAAISWHWSIDVSMVGPSEWKRAVLGDGYGNASKETVVEQARLRWPDFVGDPGTDQDEIDATCIALWATGLA